ncbi:MAG: hypothetical protein K0B11_07600 [Mariniphaga sp.]|nr:hypothetical protein [Mariniphaga sp.]
MRKISLFLLCVFLLAACEKEDLTKTFISIERAMPKSGTVLADGETVYIAVKYNIAHSVLEVDGFYVQHFYKTGKDPFWITDIGTQKKITSRSGTYGHTILPLGLYPIHGNEFYYQVRLLRQNGTTLSAISFSDELYYKVTN